MTDRKQFRRILPILQLTLSGVFGSLGLWQRNRILSHDYLFGTGWNSTARFHVWPWPFKFAVISSFPSFLASLFLSWPISALWPELPESAQLIPSLLFVLVLWYWIGSWLDKYWGWTERTPWMLLALFTAASLIGALAPMGYVGYLPYALFVWLVGAAALRQTADQLSRPRL